MSVVTVIWSMIAAACLTLAAVHFPVWVHDRQARPSLCFALMAVATAALAFCELTMLQARTPAAYGDALRWAHVPVFVLLVSLVAFVRTSLKAGRPWLGWSAIALRAVSLVLDFTTGQNLNYREISALGQVNLLGEAVSVAQGIRNPWVLVGQLGVWLLIAFLLDASVAAWRRNQRRAALSVGGSALFFALGAIVQPTLTFWAEVQAPSTISLFYLGVIAATAYELSRDVQRARQLVQELRESEERMRLAADAAQLGIWVRDLARGDFWASARARELFGIGPFEVTDLEGLLRRVEPGDRETVRRVLVEARRGEDDYQIEFRAALDDGSTRWIEAQGRVDFDEQDRPIRTRGACRDISARKHAEQELLRLRQEIAHAGRVSAMGHLAAALAHEINQPLGAILRNAEAAALLLDATPPDLPELRAIVEDILADDQRAGAVIDRMRAMLRRHEIDVLPLHVADLVGEVADLVRPDAGARRVSLDLRIPADLPPVLGDRVHLQQVLLNLIANGMDAIDEAGTRLRRIAVSAVCNGEQSVEISVADSGPGIPHDGAERIFRSFFTTKRGGMGMGLSISRNLVETHGGRLWAENLAGGGASFRFTVPIAAEAR